MLQTDRLIIVPLSVLIVLLTLMPMPAKGSDAKGNYVALGH
jgi:hypothetical protein